MKIPYLLRRVRSGAIRFPLHGKYYWVHDDDTMTTDDGAPVEGDGRISWLQASAILYRQKRNQDNMQVRAARRKAIKWIIYMIITTPIVAWCLSQ